VRPASGYAVNIAQRAAWERPAPVCRIGIDDGAAGWQVYGGKPPCQAPPGISAMGQKRPSAADLATFKTVFRSGHPLQVIQPKVIKL
jgi:hypothetical protein